MGQLTGQLHLWAWAASPTGGLCHDRAGQCGWCITEAWHAVGVRDLQGPEQIQGVKLRASQETVQIRLQGVNTMKEVGWVKKVLEGLSGWRTGGALVDLQVSAE